MPAQVDELRGAPTWQYTMPAVPRASSLTVSTKILRSLAEAVLPLLASVRGAAAVLAPPWSYLQRHDITVSVCVKHADMVSHVPL